MPRLGNQTYLVFELDLQGFSVEWQRNSVIADIPAKKEAPTYQPSTSPVSPPTPYVREHAAAKRLLQNCNPVAVGDEQGNTYQELEMSNRVL